MGAFRAMWNLITGRPSAVDVQQAEVTKALAAERERMRANMRELTAETDGLVGSDVRMRDFFAGLQARTGRTKQGRH